MQRGHIAAGGGRRAVRKGVRCTGEQQHVTDDDAEKTSLDYDLLVHRSSRKTVRWFGSIGNGEKWKHVEREKKRRGAQLIEVIACSLQRVRN